MGMVAVGRLRILRIDPMPDARRCAMVLMVLEGVLKVGASIQLESGYLRILAMAKPNYRRQIAKEIKVEDMLNVAGTGETVEALADISPLHSQFEDLLYHDLYFQEHS